MILQEYFETKYVCNKCSLMVINNRFKNHTEPTPICNCKNIMTFFLQVPHNPRMFTELKEK